MIQPSAQIDRSGPGPAGAKRRAGAVGWLVAEDDPVAGKAARYSRRRYLIEQTTVTGRAGLPRATRSPEVAAQIICPDCISGLRPVTW